MAPKKNNWNELAKTGEYNNINTSVHRQRHGPKVYIVSLFVAPSLKDAILELSAGPSAFFFALSSARELTTFTSTHSSP